MRRHPLLVLFSLLAALVLAAAVFFVVTFDLNHYRGQLEAALRGLFGKPVRVAAAHLGLDGGLAVEFHDVRVGTAGEDPLALESRRLFLRLSLRALVRGRLEVHAVRFEEPRIALVLAPSAGDGSAAAGDGTEREILKRLELRSCILNNGRLSLVDRRKPGETRRFTLSGLEGRLENLAAGEEARVRLRGTLEHANADAQLALDGTFAVPAPPRLRIPDRYRLAATLERLPLPWLGIPEPETGQPALTGRTTLAATLADDPERGPRAELTLNGEALVLHLPGADPVEGPFQRLDWRGSWQDAGRPRLSGNLTAQVGDVTLTGRLGAERTGGAVRLETRLTLPELPLATALELVARGGGEFAARLRERLESGTLYDLELRADLSLAELNRRALLEQIRASLRFSGVAADLGPVGRLEQGHGTLEFADRALSLSGAGAEIAGGRVALAGRLELPAGEPVRQQLTVSGELSAAQLLARFVPSAPGDLVVTGSLPFSLDLHGAPDRPLFDLSAQLEPLELRYAERFRKPAGQPGDLLLSGELTPGRLEIGHGRLRLPPFDLKANGVLWRLPARPFELDLSLPAVALAELPGRVPALAPLEPRGELSLDLHLAGREDRLESYSGSLTLQNLGLKTTEVIADLRDLTGLIRLETGRARFEGLSARLGTSPVDLSGTVELAPQPLLALRLQAPTLRADELIFPSPSAVLHDLDARLELSRERLRFLPATVRLAGGTKATVRGEVRFTRPAVVDLDIVADYGNIDEVIALWHREGEPPPRREGGGAEIRIAATAHRGVIGGMAFRDAEGLITRHERTLVIHPLRCKIGEGYAIGQVLVQPEAGGSLLRISGHAEDVDAGTVYRQLLDHESLVKGSLRGDFYLEGRSGGEFLATSLGGFSIEVRSGVLRRFRFLSRVFSLLNVSQILALKAPDMDEEGMPFDRLTANFRLDEGILSSEDLFVDSNAMNLSMVGDLDLRRGRVDAVLGVKPLRTVDKILTNIPIAGWLLAGEEKALITAHFSVLGATEDPEVVPIPINSVSEKVIGIFRRVLGLPGRMAENVEELVEGGN